MALPPALQALAIGSVSAPNVLELYVDYLCTCNLLTQAPFLQRS